MPDPNREQAALREACAASLYGFGDDYRRSDAFGNTLASICRWAAAAGPYEQASVDVFTGNGPLTVAGSAQPATVLDTVRGVVTAHPRRRFHALPVFPAVVGDAVADPSLAHPVAHPGAWAGATLFTTTGAVLGCLDLWSAVPQWHDDATHELLPLLARSVMHVLDEQQRILAGRVVPAPGPRAVVTRRSGT